MAATSGREPRVDARLSTEPEGSTAAHAREGYRPAPGNGAIADAVARDPDARLFASLPGAGPVIVATLIAEIGEHRSRFPTAVSLLADAELAPVTRQSGSSRRAVFRCAANHHLRAIWNQWILTALRISSWTREAYDAARARRQSHSRAVRSVGAR